MALGVLAASQAGASAIEPFDAELFAAAEVLFGTGTFVDEFEVQAVPAAIKDPTIEAGALVGVEPATGFPGAPTGDGDDFVAAEVRGDGSYGLGASSVSFSTQFRQAKITYDQYFHNFDAASPRVSVVFQIPEIRLGVFGTVSTNDVGARAFAQASYAIRDPDGNVVDAGDMFTYSISIGKNAGQIDPVTGAITHTAPTIEINDTLQTLIDH